MQLDYFTHEKYTNREKYLRERRKEGFLLIGMRIRYRAKRKAICNQQSIVMSFRNYNIGGQQQPRNQQASSTAFVPSNFTPAQSSCKTGSVQEEVLKKISDVIVGLHESCLLKCQNVEIYRDLSQEEQNLLLLAEKNTPLHTALAGILAVDSCVKAIDKEEHFLISNCSRALTTFLGQYQALQREIVKMETCPTDLFVRSTDGLKYLAQQLHLLPAARSREGDLERQLAVIDGEGENDAFQWSKAQHSELVSELAKENELLKIGLREKEGYIKTLQAKMDKFGKGIIEDKKTSHSLGMKIQTERSSQNESSGSMQQYYEEITRLKQELLEKNNIVIKMNEQFASEMEKYNSVFKRLEEENKLLKKYNDVDTAYLLEELQYELETLRDQKRKDQLLIADIQRKIDGISFARTSRVSTRPYEYFQPHYDNSYQPAPTHQQTPHFFDRQVEPAPRYSKYYSPNYPPTNRHSPYSRNSYKEEIPVQYATYNANQEGFRQRGTIKKPEMEVRAKSRSRFSGLRDSRQAVVGFEPKSSPNINLYQRVMAKRR